MVVMFQTKELAQNRRDDVVLYSLSIQQNKIERYTIFKISSQEIYQTRAE